MPIARLATVPMWYDERGDGDSLVLLHPGGAGIDSRALTASLEALSRLFRTYAPEQRPTGIPRTSTARSATGTWPRTRSRSSTPSSAGRSACSVTATEPSWL